MILPHELGHALAARRLKYDQIRILLGSGPTVATFTLLGFPCVLNLFPFGGFTLSKPGSRYNWKGYFLYVAAGPAINLIIAFIVLLVAPLSSIFFHLGSWWAALFWANVVVLLNNLIPSKTSTRFGISPNDGYQLCQLLISRDNPAADLTKLDRKVYPWVSYAILTIAGLICFWITVRVLGLNLSSVGQIVDAGRTVAGLLGWDF